MIRVVNPGRRFGNPGQQNNPEAMDHVVAARVLLVHPTTKQYVAGRSPARPYLSTAVMSLQLVESHHPSLTTAAVDSSWRMYFNAEFVLRSDIEVIASVIEHEIWHLLQRHGDRAERMGVNKYTHQLWNIAADCEIHNDDMLYQRLLKTGITPVSAEKIGCEPGLLAEEYYYFLLEKAEVDEDDNGTTITIDLGDDDQDEGDSDGGGGEGEEEGEGEGEGGYGDDDDDGEDEGQGKPGRLGQKPGGGLGGQIVIHIPKPQPGDEPGGGPGGGSGEEPGEGDFIDKYNPGGSSATNVPNPWELPPTEDYVTRSRAETIIRETVKKIYREASLGRGTDPSDAALAWAETELGGRVDWREELRSRISSAVAYVSGSSDFSRRKLSRRQGSAPYIMAGLQHPLPELAVVVDVSGSMYSAFREGGGDKHEKAVENYNLLEQAIAETDSIIQDFGQIGGVNVFATDTAVAWAGKVYSPGQIKIPQTGGGTDIAAGMNAAFFSQPQPNVMVVLTDGATPWPDSAPEGVKVVVGIIGSREEQLAEAGWALPGWADIVYIT